MLCLWAALSFRLLPATVTVRAGTNQAVVWQERPTSHRLRPQEHVQRLRRNVQRLRTIIQSQTNEVESGISKCEPDRVEYLKNLHTRLIRISSIDDYNHRAMLRRPAICCPDSTARHAATAYWACADKIFALHAHLRTCLFGPSLFVVRLSAFLSAGIDS